MHNDSESLLNVNSFSLPHWNSAVLSNAYMRTIDEIRLSNLKTLRDQYRSIAELNVALQRRRNDTTLAALLRRDIDPKTGKPRKIGHGIARSIERALRLDAGWMDTDHQKSAEKTNHADDANTLPGPRVTGRVPLISSVQAGEMTDATDLHAPGVAEDWIDTTVPVHAHTYALRVRGDSMEPDFPEGCCIIVEPDLDPQPGDFVIAKNGSDDVNFKQLIKDGPDWYLKPLNPRYPLKPLHSSVVIGVVRELVRRFR